MLERRQAFQQREGGAAQVAKAYFDWLPHGIGPWIRVHQLDHDNWAFRLRGVPIDVLRLRDGGARSFEDRALFWVTGGALVARDSPATARLEFRQALDQRTVLAAIHEFKPRLPWLVYKFTQAVAHLWVMRAFGRFLAAQRGVATTAS